MSLRKCSAQNCLRRDIVAMQRQIQIKSTANGSDQQSPTETIGFNYFCKIHFDYNELKKENVKLIPKADALAAETNATLKNTSRKRVSGNPESHTKKIKINENDTFYTLNEKANLKDNTQVNMSSFPEFLTADSCKYDECEDSELTTLVEIDRSEDSVIISDDEECIITKEQPEKIIDVEAEDGSSKMIDLILCNESDPLDNDTEPLETEEQYLVEILDEDHNDHNEQVTSQPPEIESIMLQEENNEIPTTHDASSSIDLADKEAADHETIVDVQSYRARVIKQVERKVHSMCPKLLKSISWNDKTQQFEVCLFKKSAHMEDKEFQQYLRETVNEAVRRHKALSSAIIEQQKLYSPYIHSNPMSKDVKNVAKIPFITQTIHQILESPSTYLGVRAKTFCRIETLLAVKIPNRPVLLLLLRKIKLNEPFSVLCDLICPYDDPDNKFCIESYAEHLELVSHSLTRFRQPKYSRKPLTIIMDVFEMEIQKPTSVVQQNISYCSRRHRYLVKFIICLSCTGLITHVSTPFHSIRSSILSESLAKIPTTFTILANSNLLDFTDRPFISLFDRDHIAERKTPQHLFDRMRCFSLINSIEKLENVVTLVASLCNLENK